MNLLDAELFMLLSNQEGGDESNKCTDCIQPVMMSRAKWDQ